MWFYTFKPVFLQLYTKTNEEACGTTEELPGTSEALERTSDEQNKTPDVF